jgi:hypothetical protein
VLLLQVTTHSKLVTERERQDLERQLPGFTFKLLSLQAFHTEQQFRHQLRYCTFHSKFLLDAIVKAGGSHTGNGTLVTHFFARTFFGVMD